MGYTDIEWKFHSIGKNVQIGKNVYIRYPELVDIGDNVIIDDFSYFTTAMSIGNNVHIGPHCSCIGGKSAKLIMQDFSGMAAGVRLICNSDDFRKGLTGPTIPPEYRKALCAGGFICICEHGLLGTGSVVHPNVTIEKGAATGSMALVLHDLEPWTIYAGIPATILGRRDKFSILDEEARYKGGMGEV